MRYKEFLLEYDRSREQQRIESLPAYEQRIKQEPEFSLERLESGDPTPQKIYVPKLVQWWLAGEPIEDLISTTADALAKYHTLKNKKLIRPEHADIGRFKTADQFTDMISQYQLPQDKPQEVDRGKYKEIFRDAELLVVQLLDETAAKFWGQSTKWCTAAQRNNMFDFYHKQGPLYVIIPRKDSANKYQLWWAKTNVYNMQFMNVKDEPAIPQDLSFYQKLSSIMYPIHKHIMWNPNPTEQEQLTAVHASWRVIEYIKSPSETAQLAAVQQNKSAIDYIDNPTETVRQIIAVKEKFDALKKIKNPTEEVQLASVSTHGDSIQYIKNPSETVQLAAVKKYGGSIQYIKDPSEAIQLAAVQTNGEALENIKNPSEAVQLAAVHKNPFVINSIKNPSENVQLAAVQSSGVTIFNIANPSEKVKLAAVQNDGTAIHHIKNPSEKVQLAAVNQEGRAIRFIKNPSEAVQLAAVKKDGRAIKHIKNPSEAVQMAAVRQNTKVLKNIKNPTPRVQALAKELGSTK